MMKCMFSFLICFAGILGILAGCRLNGDDNGTTPVVKLTAADAADGDFFGSAVSLSGDYALIGAPYDDDNGDESGSAYIFRRNGGTWNQEAKLSADDGAEGDMFALSALSLAGDYAVVGARYDDDKGANSGSVYVFHRSGNSWSQEAKLYADDGAIGDCFGRSVSLDGEYLIVGAHRADDEAGAAYIFQRGESAWSQKAELLASDAAPIEYFGCSVSLSGDYAIVGAYWDDPITGTNSGAAYIFHRSGNDWTQEAVLSADDGAERDEFAYSVSLSGDYAIVGAKFDDDNGVNSGSAYIFRRSGTQWSQEAKLSPDDGATSDEFGYSVSLSGSYAIVGTHPGDSSNTPGAAYIFQRSGSTWTQKAKLSAADGERLDKFGASVSLSEDYAIIGVPGDDDDGSVYINSYR